MGKIFDQEKYNNLLSAQSYLRQINRIPLLTPEEEFKLAARCRKYNDRESVDKLITSNLRFVVKVAMEYKTYGIKLLDLIQEGNIGLMMAVKKFNPYKGYRFISYSVWWIRAYIQNFIMKSWSLVKIGTTQAQKKLFYKIGKVRKALEADGESEAKYEHLASDLDVKKGDIIEIEQRMSARDFSLDSPLDDNQELTHLDLLQEKSLNQEESLALEEEKKILERDVLSAMKHLNQKEEYVIRNRIMSDSSLTLREIGNHLKLSRERVRQIESEALKKLRKEMSPSPRTKGLAGGMEHAYLRIPVQPLGGFGLINAPCLEGAPACAKASAGRLEP
jgi:RNA polymerase sigma-32 factor